MTAAGNLSLSAVRWAENVSRETLERFRIYEALLIHWNRSVNLVAESTLSRVWERHFLDSIQLLNYAPDAVRWLDIGSGAGFPGLAIAILAAETQPGSDFTLMEASSRKCGFLRAVVQETGVRAAVQETRCENAAPWNADALTARAVAPLPKLLKLAAPHLAAEGRLIFPKGRNRAAEIRSAQREWTFEFHERLSITDPDSAILVIKSLKRDRKR